MLAKTTSFQKEQKSFSGSDYNFKPEQLQLHLRTFAIKDNLIEVKEVSEGGSVNTLHVFNLSNQFVFFMDAISFPEQKDRVLNTSVLLHRIQSRRFRLAVWRGARWSHISAKFGKYGLLCTIFHES